MKTTRFSVLKKALSVFLACLMVLGGLSASSPLLRANADAYGFDATTAAWTTDKKNWRPIEKSLYSITGYDLLLVYEKDGKLFAFASNSTSISPIRIAMASSEGGLVRYSQTSVNAGTSNSGDIPNTLYWQTSVGFEGANHNMNFKLGNAYTGYGIVKEEYNLAYSGITTFTVDDNGLINGYKAKEGIYWGNNSVMLSSSGDYNVRVYYNNGELARSSITYNANGGTGSVATQTDIVGYSVTIQGNGFSKAGYHFTGWNTAANGSGTPYSPGQSYMFGNSMTLYAQWEADKFPIRFLNYDGTELQNSEFAYGTTPVYSGTTPAKPGNAQYSYSFTGWSPAIHAVTGAETYTAQFSENVNKYTVTWNNWDGTELEKDTNVPYGTTPSYDSATPSKAATAQYTYTFAGWSPSVSTITGNVTYTATYSQTLRKYTVTWKNADGTTLETDTNVPYGATPEYNGTTPAKQATAQYTYTFAGWSPSVSSVTGDVTYTATYSSTLRKYTVTWKNDDGAELEKDENVPYGTTPSYDGTTPAKQATAQYTYTFAGWSPSVSSVTGDVTYTATFGSTLRKYTVIWQNWDGAELEKDENVPYGTVPNYDGETPVREGSAQYSYTFIGWTPETTEDPIQGDVIFAAVFREDTNAYTVYWVNWDGTELEKDENVPYGTTPSYDGATPARRANAQYTYAFAYWTPEVSAVTGDVTYTAHFTETLNKYTVIWKNGDTVLETDENVPYGQLPVYDGDTPAQAADAQYTYAFAGWTPEVHTVDGDIAYTAVFTPTLRSYQITFLDENGDVLQDTAFAYGTTPVFSGTTPDKEDTAEYDYTFTGWTPEISEVTGEATYTATYRADKKSYKITFKDEDGAILQDTPFEYGEMPAYNGETPNKEDTAEYDYTFIGWTPEISAVTGEATYTAAYRADKKSYTIIFQDEDGAVLQDTAFEYGETPVYSGETPDKEDTAEYDYTFTGWTPGISEVTGEATYTATYRADKKSYTITFEDEDGAVLQDTAFEYGETPVYNGETPDKEDTAEYDYTFIGWTPEISAVTGEATYTAVYRADKKNYTITWLNEDGTLLGDDTVEYGRTPVYGGETPEKEPTDEHSFTFAGWDPEIVPVTENKTYTAKYSSGPRTYTVTWLDADGSVLRKDTGLAWGAEPSYGADPEKEDTAEYDYTFAGWAPAVIPVAGDASYTASYTAEKRSYTVTFADEDGTVLQDTAFEYGETPVYSGETPDKEDTAEYDYTFTGWTPEISEVTGEATYTATYRADKRSYTVIFADEDGTVLQDTAFEYGETPVYNGETPDKEDTAEYDYTFIGWTPEISEVTGEATYTATYRADKKSYTITFKNEDGTVLQDTAFEYGDTPVFSGTTPEKASTAECDYTFAGWTPEISAVTGETTYTAVFTPVGHNWEFTGFTWTGNVTDGYVVIANYVCHNGTAHYGTVVATVTFERAEPTCTEAGSVTYTAYVSAENSLDGVEHTDTKTVALPALGHNWGPWTVVREATFEEDGLERRECRRCGAAEERVIVWKGNATREIQFVVSFPMHYIAQIRSGDYYVFSDTTPVLYWYPEVPLRFRVEVYTTWDVTGYIVAANGHALRPDAEGYYTIPAGTERVVITCDPTTAPAETIDELRCPYCGNVHPDTLWGFLIGMVHQFFAMFKKIGR